MINPCPLKSCKNPFLEIVFSPPSAEEPGKNLGQSDKILKPLKVSLTTFPVRKPLVSSPSRGNILRGGQSEEPDSTSYDLIHTSYFNSLHSLAV